MASLGKEKNFIVNIPRHLHRQLGHLLGLMANTDIKIVALNSPRNQERDCDGKVAGSEEEEEWFESSRLVVTDNTYVASSLFIYTDLFILSK